MYIIFLKHIKSIKEAVTCKERKAKFSTRNSELISFLYAFIFLGGEKWEDQ